MPYAKIDHTILTDPKVAKLSMGDRGVFVMAIAFCSREETDGHFSAGALAIACHSRGLAPALLRLTSAGLVAELGQNYVIPNYLKYNTSQADIAAKRDLAKARVTLYRANQSTENRVQRTENKDLKGIKRAKPRPPKAKKWTVVPESWEPSETHRDKAQRLKLPFDKELNKFRLWEFKDAKSDADRAFHRWLDMASERRAAGPAQGGFIPHEAPKTKRQIAQHAEIAALMKEVPRESVG